MEIDIKTGLPKEMVEAGKAQREAETDSRLSSEGREISEEINSRAGKKIIAEITKILEERAEIVIANDTECQAMLNILRAIGYKLSLAKTITDKMIKRSLRVV
ncbi:MAG: hypothetical protein KKF33_20335 [Alphaproteobacteria bacterium]|nr:hypothetical protein [Alphaproteobacteria bacterium]